MPEQADAVDRRWLFYRDTLVVIDVPGLEMVLNGPTGVDPWPFDGVVHVLTAWAPRGAHRPTAVNLAANADLAASIVRSGGGLLAAKGVARRTDYAGEPGWLTWGLTRPKAVELGQQYVQDAIYEIDADLIRILDCSGESGVGRIGRFEEYSRRM